MSNEEKASILDPAPDACISGCNITRFAESALYYRCIAGCTDCRKEAP